MQQKILIIEDNNFSANIYQEHFAHAGFIPKIAPDGRIALDLIDTFHPNLIILDLILPKIDGFTLLHLIKNIPIIIISNLNQKNDIEKCLNLGAKTFITKESINYNKLITLINSLLHH